MFLVGSCQQLSADWHPETSSHYQQRRNLSHFPPVKDKLLGLLLFILFPLSLASAVCLRDLLQWNSPKTDNLSWVWWLPVLLEQIVCPFLLLGQSRASTTKSPNAIHQEHCQLFFIWCLPCTPAWHHTWALLLEDPQPGIGSEATGGILAKRKTALLQSVTGIPSELFSWLLRKHRPLHSHAKHFQHQSFCSKRQGNQILEVRSRTVSGVLSAILDSSTSYPMWKWEEERHKSSLFTKKVS